MGLERISISIFEHALDVTTDNYLAHNNLGNAYLRAGRNREAGMQYSMALSIKPAFAEAQNNLGAAMFRAGKTDMAIKHFSLALTINPEYKDALYNLKNISAGIEVVKKKADKLQDDKKGLMEDYRILLAMGNLYRDEGFIDKAVEYYEYALLIQPGFMDALNNLATIYIYWEEYDKAVVYLEQIVKFYPGIVKTYYTISCLYSALKKPEKSVEWLKKAAKMGFADWSKIRSDKKFNPIRRTKIFKDYMTGR